MKRVNRFFTKRFNRVVFREREGIMGRASTNVISHVRRYSPLDTTMIFGFLILAKCFEPIDAQPNADEWQPSPG